MQRDSASELVAPHLLEINLDTEEEPRPIYISALLTDEEKEAYRGKDPIWSLEPSLTTDDKPIKFSAREQVQPRPRPEGVLPFAMKEEKMRAGRTTRDDRSEEMRH